MIRSVNFDFFNIYLEPPPKHCIATIMTRKQKMKIGDTWFTEDPCLTEMCVHDEDGKPKIDKKKKVCTEICQAVSFFYINL